MARGALAAGLDCSSGLRLPGCVPSSAVRTGRGMADADPSVAS